MAEVVSPAARALLKGLVDYAGLFPPAELAMGPSVREYETQRTSAESFLLGRFIVPEARLQEFRESKEALGPGDPWRLSVLLPPGTIPDQNLMNSISARLGRAAVPDTVELKAGTVAEIDRALAGLPAKVVAYVELPLGSEGPLIHALFRHGGRAKVRTGGTSPGSVAEPGALARFLVTAARAKVAFKATAGLHHAVRSLQPLTYAEGSPRELMHGFMNVFAAAALAFEGRDADRVEEVIREERPGSFSFDEGGLRAGQEFITLRSLEDFRGSFACAFGSCSFSEPVADLRALGVL